MTEQPQGNQTAYNFSKWVDNIGLVVAQVTANARVDAAFGEPQTMGDRTVIPVAEAMCGVGFGGGGGEGPADQTERPGTAGGFGGGAGGGARTRPIAVIVVEPQGVTVRPMVDVTQLSLAALAVLAFGLRWGRGATRKRREIEEGRAIPSGGKLARLLRS